MTTLSSVGLGVVTFLLGCIVMAVFVVAALTYLNRKSKR